MKKWSATQFISLDKKVLAVVLCVNILFALTWANFDIFLQKRNGDENLKRDLAYIQAIILPAVENSVWKMDIEQCRLQLQGMLTNPHIARVVILEKESSQLPVLDVHKNESHHNLNKRTYDLYSPTNPRTAFATMTLYITMDPVISRINDEMMKHFIFNFLQTLILSFLILAVFRVLVLSRLAKILTYFRNNSYISHLTQTISHKASPFYPDEFDNLIEAINRTVDESKKYQSEIEKLKDQANRANQAKSIFLANANHELRTPLSAILGIIDLIPDSCDNPLKQKKLLELQKRSGLHLLYLIDEILDLSKIEAGEMKIEQIPMDLQESLKTCQLIMEKQAEEKNNKLQFHIEKDFPQKIIGDPYRIVQIIINLISNANKFTARGRIDIHVNRLNENFEINVIDTGSGIPQNKLNEIFLPFKQVDGFSSASRQGTGVGLSIAKNLVEMMGGKISVKSALGAGSLFHVALPLKEVTSRSDNRPTVNDNNLVFEEKLKVLVVEDTFQIRLILQAYLKKANVDLSFAENGKEGVSRFKEAQYSLILMDLQMPEMNGYEATKAIRKLELATNQQRTPIVAMTALTTKSDIDLAMQSGFDGYMTKPFSREKLIQTLQKFSSAPGAAAKDRTADSSYS